MTIILVIILAVVYLIGFLFLLSLCDLRNTTSWQRWCYTIKLFFGWWVLALSDAVSTLRPSR